MSELTLQEIAPEVMAALGGVCNRGIISHGGHVLVIDSGVSVTEATPLRASAQAYRTQGTLYLFNTHPHGDHVYGNQVFADCPMIAHKGVREDLVRSGEQTLANWRRMPQMAEYVSDVTITPPTVLFEQRMMLLLGDIEIQFLHLGRAHSPSDSVAWLPQLRILFTGDLLFNAIVPAMPPGVNTATWVRALEQLEQLEAAHVIPGHGPVQTPAALADLRNWFLTLRAQVGEAIASGWDRETTVSNVSTAMQAMAPRSLAERLPMGIGHVYDEMVGAPER